MVVEFRGIGLVVGKDVAIGVDDGNAAAKGRSQFIHPGPERIELSRFQIALEEIGGERYLADHAFARAVDIGAVEPDGGKHPYRRCRRADQQQVGKEQSAKKSAGEQSLIRRIRFRVQGSLTSDLDA